MNPFEEIKFPQYRKYLNEKSYFKIISVSEFEEIQLVGSKKIVTLHSAKILPDRNLIYDLLLNYTEFGVEINEEEYSAIKSQA